MFEAGRWGFLLNLIDHLPRTSAYVQAMADDEELAAELPEDEGGPRRDVPLREWSSQVELQAAIFDRLGELINAVIVGNGGKPSRVDPWPTPVLASQRVQAKRRRELADQMAAKLWPKREGGADGAR